MFVLIFYVLLLCYCTSTMLFFMYATFLHILFLYPIFFCVLFSRFVLTEPRDAEVSKAGQVFLLMALEEFTGFFLIWKKMFSRGFLVPYRADWRCLHAYFHPRSDARRYLFFCRTFVTFSCVFHSFFVPMFVFHLKSPVLYCIALSSFFSLNGSFQLNVLVCSEVLCGRPAGHQSGAPTLLYL